MRFATIAVQNLRGHLVRSSLASLGLALAVCALVTLMSFAHGFEHSFSTIYISRDVDLIVQRTGSDEVLLRGLSEETRHKIGRLPGVARTAGGMVDIVSFEEFNLFFVLVYGMRTDHPFLRDVKLLSGRSLRDNDRGKVMLGRVLAANLGAQVGAQVQLYGAPYEVIGVFESFTVFENSAAWMPLEELQRKTDRLGKLTSVPVTVEKPADRAAIDRVARTIEQQLPGTMALPTEEFVANVRQLRWCRGLVSVTSTIALGIGMLGIANTMLMSVIERVREFGTLRAVGWRKLEIVRLVIYEAATVSLAGGVAGIVLAWGVLTIASHMPRTSSIVEGTIPASLVIEALLIPLAVGIAGACGPAYFAIRRAPFDSLRVH